MTWVALGDVTQNLDAQRVPVRSSLREAGPYPYYGASGVVDWVSEFLFEGQHLLVAEDGENLRSRNTPIAFLADGRFWVNNHAHVLTAVQGVSDIRYICYQLQLADVTGYLTGSAQPKLNRAALDSIEVWLPDLATQTAIADVLGALDDKIAANQQANESARALSQALVVRESAAAPVVSLSEVAEVRKNTITPPPGEVWHFSLPAFDDGEVPRLEDGTEIKSAKQRLERSSVLLSKLNPRIPRVWDVASVPRDRPALASTEFIVLEPRSGASAELAAALQLPASLVGLQSLARGTSGSHQRVSPADAMALEVPDYTQFSGAIRRMLTDLAVATEVRLQESRRLAATRDALLPALMSGRLSVNRS